MNRRKLYLGIVAALILALTAYALVGIVLAATVLVDTFDDGELFVQTGSAAGTSAHGWEDCTGCIGGQRDVFVQKINTGGRVNIGVDLGRASFDQGSTAQGWGRIVWDGEDDNGAVIDKTGLGGVDLTDNNTNDGFQLLVYNFDAGSGGEFRMGIWVYTNTLATYYTLTLDTAVAPPGQSFFIPFTQFDGDDIFDDAGAVEFRFAPDVDVDLTVDLLEVTAQTDWGDLPENGTLVSGIARYYTTTRQYDGPRHVKGDIWLGARIDLEANGFPSNLANGDDNNNLPDEDGIQRRSTDSWADGTTAYLTATVTGGSGYLVAWFDWDNDGLFDDGHHKWSVSAGINTVSLTVPAAYNQGELFARFRLYKTDPGDSPSHMGQVTNGEVEDYYWPVVPTAVTLAAFEAQSQANAVLVTWETAAELDNLGFNLYRSAAAAGPWTQLNAELIPAQNPGAVFGAVYEWLDADAAPGALAYYRLEDVDIHGVSTFHGPVSAAPLSPSAVRLSNFSAGGPFIGLALALGSLALFTGLKKRR